MFSIKIHAMNCVIVDDEMMDLLAVKELLKAYEDVKVIGFFQDPIEAKSFTEGNKVDLLVLDVEMPGLNGIDFVKKIDSVEHIILISSNKEYAAESYDYNVSDYIIKPASKDRLDKAIEKIRAINESVKVGTSEDKGEQAAYVRDGNKIVRINYKDIIFVEALADYVQINTVDARYTVLSTMKSLSAKLPQDDFYRVHRSFIVRIDKIKTIEDGMIVMDKKNIPISRSAKQEFFNTFNFL